MRLAATDVAGAPPSAAQSIGVRSNNDPPTVSEAHASGAMGGDGLRRGAGMASASAKRSRRFRAAAAVLLALMLGLDFAATTLTPALGRTEWRLLARMSFAHSAGVWPPSFAVKELR
jgi:hypothetical protein